LRQLVALVLLCIAVPYTFGCALHLPVAPPKLHWPPMGHAVEVQTTADDRDGDGIPDLLEDELLRTYSPTALLAGSETAWPASVAWLRARTDIAVDGPETLGIVVPRHPFDASLRRGSRDTRDWTVYGHAYPRKGGGIVLQYWLYFPFNAGPVFLFDHESDWEHSSVELNARMEPESFILSRHNNNAPGVRYPWAQAPKEGTHPFYLVAKGSHAGYMRASEAPFWESVTDCPRNADGTPRLSECPVEAWRSGGAPGRPSPLVNVGERLAPRRDGDPDGFFMGYHGLWGTAAVMQLSSAAPPGPPYQAGFCSNAQPGSCS
jgi:hypothetical protein